MTRDDNGIRRMLGVLGALGRMLGGCHMCWEGCHVEKTHLKFLFQATRASRKTMGVDKGTRKDGI